MPEWKCRTDIGSNVIPPAAARKARERADRLARLQRARAAQEAAERAAAIADAQAIWNASGPLPDSLGEPSYLTDPRGLPRPATGWPDCHPIPSWQADGGCRRHPPTTASVQFVHRIYLEADGTNVRRDGNKLKLSRGPMDGAAISAAALTIPTATQHGEGLESR